MAIADTIAAFADAYAISYPDKATLQLAGSNKPHELNKIICIAITATIVTTARVAVIAEIIAPFTSSGVTAFLNPGAHFPNITYLFSLKGSPSFHCGYFVNSQCVVSL